MQKSVRGNKSAEAFNDILLNNHPRCISLHQDLIIDCHIVSQPLIHFLLEIKSSVKWCGIVEKYLLRTRFE